MPHKRHSERNEIWRDDSAPSELDVALARDWVCPKCLEELDDGAVCTGCAFDAIEIIVYPELFP